MEYFPLRDLRRFMDTRPPFSEDSTRQIARQLVEGIRFMHESGFAHRDLKPGVHLFPEHISWSAENADCDVEYTCSIRLATLGRQNRRLWHQ